LVPFLVAAQRRGDEVRVIGPPALREMVQREGFTFVPGGEPPEAEIAPIREQLAVAAPLEASVLGNRELFGRLAADAMLPAADRFVEEWQPDLVLRDPAEFASAVVAHRRSVPVGQVAISLAEVEAGSLAVAAPALDRHGAGITDALRAEPYLTRFPDALDPSPFATTIRYHDGDSSEPVALPDWWAGSRAPLVYVTFGTVLGFMSIAADVFKVATAAVGSFDARVLLTVGHEFDRTGALGAVPDHVHVEPWVDQADVLAAADLVVCHGGSGTVYGALAAGVPLVVVPVFADQFENAHRVTRSGAGIAVEQQRHDGRGARTPIDADAVPRITGAIQQVLADPSFRTRAQTIASEMAETPTVADALERISG
jgi:UDP:flavonoid glycosyltransferase YjiC (YdhE family)